MNDTIAIERNEDTRRYELTVDGELAGYADSAVSRDASRSRTRSCAPSTKARVSAPASRSSSSTTPSRAASGSCPGARSSPPTCGSTAATRHPSTGPRSAGRRAARPARAVLTLIRGDARIPCRSYDSSKPESARTRLVRRASTTWARFRSIPRVLLAELSSGRSAGEASLGGRGGVGGRVPTPPSRPARSNKHRDRGGRSDRAAEDHHRTSRTRRPERRAPDGGGGVGFQ